MFTVGQKDSGVLLVSESGDEVLLKCNRCGEEVDAGDLDLGDLENEYLPASPKRFREVLIDDGHRGVTSGRSYTAD
jgi:hypothetical protein